MSGYIVEFVDVMKYELGDSLKGLSIYSFIDGQSIFEISFAEPDTCKLSEWISIVNSETEHLISNSAFASSMELMLIKLRSGYNIFLYPIMKGHIVLALSVISDISIARIYEMFEKHIEKVKQIERLFQ